MRSRRIKLLLDHFLERIGEDVKLPKKTVKQDYVKTSDLEPDEKVSALLVAALKRSTEYQDQDKMSRYIESASSHIAGPDDTKLLWYHLVRLKMRMNFFTLPENERHQIYYNISFNIDRAIKEVLSESDIQVDIPTVIEAEKEQLNG